MSFQTRMNNAYECYTCDLNFSRKEECEAHRNVVHGYSVEVYFCSEDEHMTDTLIMSKEEKKGQTVIVDSVQGELICPKCSFKSAGEYSFSKHLSVTHKAYCKLIHPETQKREHTKSDNINDYTEVISSKQYNKILAYECPPKRISRSSPSSSAPSTRTAEPVCDYNTSILMASNAMGLPKSKQEDFLMLCKIGRWKPIIYTQKDGKQYHVLTSQKSVATLLDKEPGSWSLPTPSEE